MISVFGVSMMTLRRGSEPFYTVKPTTFCDALRGLEPGNVGLDHSPSPEQKYDGKENLIHFRSPRMQTARSNENGPLVLQWNKVGRRKPV